LIGAGALWPYYVLAERAKGKVAQAEHTVIVTEDGCEVTTR
jgi:methionyl aminopeptidase